MESKWKMIIAIVIIALVAIAGLLYSQNKAKIQQPQQPSIQKPPAQSEKKVSEIAPPVATGNIDDSVDALLQDSALETLASEEENSDADLLGADTQAISDFGQSYETSEF